MHNELKKAVEVMRQGGVILYPTDTVWGIGCDATKPEAIARIYEIKRRVESKSMIVLVDSMAKVEGYVSEVPEIAWDLVEVADKPFSRAYRAELTNRICDALGVSKREAAYLHCAVTLEKDMYSPFDDHIEILYNDGTTRDISEASDMFNLSLLKKKVKKYFLCYQRI